MWQPSIEHLTETTLYIYTTTTNEYEHAKVHIDHGTALRKYDQESHQWNWGKSMTKLKARDWMFIYIWEFSE